jgi:hypothetical protein
LRQQLDVLVLGREPDRGQRRLDHRRQPVLHLDALANLAVDLAHLANDHLQDERVLVGEVVVDGRSGDAGLAGDALHEGAADAVALEGRQRRVVDLLTHISARSRRPGPIGGGMLRHGWIVANAARFSVLGKGFCVPRGARELRYRDTRMGRIVLRGFHLCELSGNISNSQHFSSK